MSAIFGGNSRVLDVVLACSYASSGNGELDIAAADIVRSGSPYAPFSEQMKREIDQVNITRIWKFTEDQNFSTSQ